MSEKTITRTVSLYEKDNKVLLWLQDRKFLNISRYIKFAVHQQIERDGYMEEYENNAEKNPES